MKLNPVLTAARPIAQLAHASVPRTCAAARSYATTNQSSSSNNSSSTSPESRRRSVTPFNDDGYVPWTDLSAGEKAARATQQSFNFGMVAVGLVLTGGVGYFLWTDVFSPDSRTAHFNRAIDKIKKDPRCAELFGDSRKIIAHGDETANKWRRARPLAASEKTDQYGTQHLIMHFHVDGPLNNGTAQLHMVKPKGHSDYEYKYLFVDAKGHDRIYLENAEAGGAGKKKLSFFGVNWG